MISQLTLYKLSHEEIDKMDSRRDEDNSEKDKQIKENVEARNALDSMVYQSEKMLKEKC